MIFHFTEKLARSLLLPLVSKKSKVRLAALEALSRLMYCGAYKYNVTIFEILTGFRDPNVVPLRDFFEDGSRLNYFAILINDEKSSVRELFIRTLAEWMIYLPDRFDHEGRIAPYLISGLYDKNQEIQEITF